MKYITNRTFIAISPKEPFVKWVNGHPQYKDEVEEEKLYKGKNLYFLDHIDFVGEQDIEDLLEENFYEIFLHECFLWYADVDYVPTIKSFEMFKKWFNWELLEMGCDLVRKKIKRENVE